jgi:predicted aspartyl protease
MEINVNGVQVQFYLDTGAEVNIIGKETFDYIGALSLQKCDEVARMYNSQTATFLGKGRAVFKRRNHATEDVFYVAP